MDAPAESKTAPGGDLVGGKCACGAVRFIARLQEGAGVGLCHCSMCRRWCGGLPFACVHAKVEQLEAGELRWWRSSGWGERGFCGLCGSSLFWRVAGDASAGSSQHEWEVSASALDSAAGLHVRQHIYIDDKPGFYEMADAAPRITGAEFTAKTLLGLAEKFGDGFLEDACSKIKAHASADFYEKVRALIDKAQT